MLPARVFNQQIQLNGQQKLAIANQLKEFVASTRQELSSRLVYDKDKCDSIFNVAALEELLRMLLLCKSDELEYAAHSAPADSHLSTFELMCSQGKMICDLDNIQVDDIPAPEDFDDVVKDESAGMNIFQSL